MLEALTHCWLGRLRHMTAQCSDQAAMQAMRISNQSAVGPGHHAESLCNIFFTDDLQLIHDGPEGGFICSRCITQLLQISSQSCGTTQLNRHFWQKCSGCLSLVLWQLQGEASDNWLQKS